MMSFVGQREGHHWTLAGPSSICLQNKQVCGWCSQHGTALYPATSWQTWDARILFVDISSAFNTIKPNLLSYNLIQLFMPTSICQLS